MYILALPRPSKFFHRYNNNMNVAFRQSWCILMNIVKFRDVGKAESHHISCRHIVFHQCVFSEACSCTQDIYLSPNVRTYVFSYVSSHLLVQATWLAKSSVFFSFTNYPNTNTIDAIWVTFWMLRNSKLCTILAVCSHVTHRCSDTRQWQLWDRFTPLYCTH